MKNLTSQTKTLILALVLTLGISYVSAASTWQAPSVAAPGGNTDVPINVGSNAQSKQGDFAVGAFLANLNSQILGNLTIGATSSSASLIIPKGASAGKVLTALDSTGTVVWGVGGGAGTSTGTCTVYDSGWFAMSNESFVTKTHNLGTDVLNISLYGASAANGGGKVVYIGFDSQGSGNYGAMVQDVTSTTLSLGTRSGYISWETGDHDTLNDWVSARILASPMGCGGGGTSATSSLKSWTDSSPLSAGKTFTVAHGFGGMPVMYKASIVKVSELASVPVASRDNYAIGDEVGSESYVQWPNSYNSPFIVQANASTITVKTDKNTQYFWHAGDGSEWPGTKIGVADMANWRLKIIALGNTNVVAIVPPVSGPGDFRMCMQSSDDACSAQFGPTSCSPWASEGGGWSPWSTDVNAQPDCMRVRLEMKGTASDRQIHGSCSPSVATVKKNVSMRWTATGVSGGQIPGTYGYQFASATSSSGIPYSAWAPSITTPTANNYIDRSYSTTGVKVETFRITSGNSSDLIDCTGTVTVTN